MDPSLNLPPSSDDSASPHRLQAEFEMGFFGRILERNPNLEDVLRRQALLLSTHGHREGALQCDERLAALRPYDSEVRYNLACSLAAVGRTDEAVDTLNAAVELGYRDFDHLESDPDLDSLREHPGYQALMKLHADE